MLGGMAKQADPPDEETPEPEPALPVHYFTPRRQAVFLASLRDGQTVKAACARAGISHQTYYRWLNDPANTDFQSRVDSARAEAEARLVDAITKSAHTGETVVTPGGKTVIRPGDWRAAAWLLEHHPHTREAYAGLLKQKVTVSQAHDGLPVDEDDPNAEMGTLERMAAVMAVLQRAGVMPQLLASETVDVSPVEVPDADKP